MKVLIIDPQFFMRAGLIQILTNYANQPSIYEADSFEIAESYLAADDYDLIFLEMDLPDAEIRPALQRSLKYARYWLQGFVATCRKTVQRSRLNWLFAPC